MDSQTQQALSALVRKRGTAALGTLHSGSPLVSLVLYAAAADLSELYIHVSRLAQHTEDLLADGRVGLLIVEDEPSSRNPLTLGRVSICGAATRLEPESAAFAAARGLYVAAHPTAKMNFQLSDFLLFRIRPDAARFVAGFGKIFDLDRQAWEELGAARL